MRSVLFIGTFSALFVLLGLGATTLGAFLFDSQPLLNKIAGAAIVVMGAFLLASAFVTRLNREWRPPGLIERAGRGGPVVAGAAFAIAWTPCVGPTLAAILGLAATQQGTAEGAALLAVYSAGLGVPFLLAAVGFSAATRSFRFLMRHWPAVQVGSGALLIAMGVLVVTGELFRLNIEAQQLLDGPRDQLLPGRVKVSRHTRALMLVGLLAVSACGGGAVDRAGDAVGNDHVEPKSRAPPTGRASSPKPRACCAPAGASPTTSCDS